MFGFMQPWSDYSGQNLDIYFMSLFQKFTLIFIFAAKEKLLSVSTSLSFYFGDGLTSG